MFKQIYLLVTLAFAQASSPYKPATCLSSSKIYELLDNASYDEKPLDKPKPNTEYFYSIGFAKQAYGYLPFYCRSEDCPWIVREGKAIQGNYNITEPKCFGNNINKDPKFNVLYHSFEATVDLRDTSLNKISLQEVGKPGRNRVISKKAK